MKDMIEDNSEKQDMDMIIRGEIKLVIGTSTDKKATCGGTTKEKRLV